MPVTGGTQRVVLLDRLEDILLILCNWSKHYLLHSILDLLKLDLVVPTNSRETIVLSNGRVNKANHLLLVAVRARNLLLGKFVGNRPIISHRAGPLRFDLIIEYHGWLSDSRSFEELTFRFILARIAPLFDVSVLGRSYGSGLLKSYLLHK